MEKVPVVKLVEFRRIANPNSKRTFVNNLKKPKISSEDGGGDYWITSVSAISNVFKFNEEKLIHNKIDELREKKEIAHANQSKYMFQRNIDILDGFINFNMAQLKPESKLNFVPKGETILKINNLPLQVKPHLVFTFEENGFKKIGAVWFIAKLGGFKKDEIGLFTECLYKHLEFNFSKNYKIDFRFCCSVDVINRMSVSYEQIASGAVPSVLDSTIESIKTFL